MLIAQQAIHESTRLSSAKYTKSLGEVTNSVVFTQSANSAIVRVSQHITYITKIEYVSPDSCDKEARDETS